MGFPPQRLSNFARSDQFLETIEYEERKKRMQRFDQTHKEVSSMKRTLVFTAIILATITQMVVAGSLSFYHSGGNAVALFTNETEQPVDGLVLTFSTAVEPTNSVGVGANMELASADGAKLLFTGDVIPMGVWEVDWPLADASLVAAAWLKDGKVVQEIDVHAPTANITINGSLIDHPIKFSALGSSDPDGKSIVKYTWTWDDGTTAEGYAVSRIYHHWGLHTATLTVVDEDGESSSRSRVFAVHKPTPRSVPALPAGYYLLSFLNIRGNDVVVGDVDNDGQNELVISSESYGGVDATLSVYEFTDGGYVLSWSDRLPYSTGGLYIGDTDNDGQNELLVGASVSSTGGGGDVRIYKYTGSNNYQKVWSDSINAHIDSGGVYVGDADNDGQNEVAVAVSWYGRQVIVYDHTTGNNYTRTWTTSAGDGKDIVIGDANNDGKNEIIAGWGYSSLGTRMYEFQGGTYHEVWSYNSGYTTRVGIGDIDNDGQNEIMAIGESHKVALQHQGGYSYVAENILPPSDTDRYDGASIGDADNDGQNEIVLLRTAPEIEQAAIIECSNGLYTTSWTSTFGSGSNVYTRYDNCYIGDSDNDGNNEVIFSTDTGVYIYRYRH